MERLIKAVVIYASVIAAVITSSWTFYAADLPVAQNYEKGGDLRLEVNDQPLPVVPMTLEGIKPGQQITKMVNLHNAGALDINSLTLSVENIDDPAGLLSHVSAGITHIASLDKECLEAGEYDAYQNLLDIVQSPLLESPYATSPPDGNVVKEQSLLERLYALPAGSYSRVELSFMVPQQLDPTLCEGKSACFNLCFNASQF